VGSWFTLLVSRLYCYNTTDLHIITDTIAECPFKNWFTKQVNIAIVIVHTRRKTCEQNIVLSRLVHYVKPFCRILYCFDSHTMWNRSACYCTVMTHAWCETFVQIIALSRLKHYVKPLGRICYCPDSHTMWNRSADYSTDTTPTWCTCETVEQTSVLWWLTYDLKPLCRLLYCYDLHTMRNRWADNCTVTTRAQCEIAVQYITVLSLSLSKSVGPWHVDIYWATDIVCLYG
jgi:hypothetical protein